MNPAAGAVPAWVGHVLIPSLNLLLALAVTGAIVAAIGEDPVRVLGLLVSGAVGYPEAISYTLYYATNFVFTGLAVAVAFHCGLFNIGGEGQAYMGGLGPVWLRSRSRAGLRPWQSLSPLPPRWRSAAFGASSPVGCGPGGAAMS